MSKKDFGDVDGTDILDLGPPRNRMDALLRDPSSVPESNAPTNTPETTPPSSPKKPEDKPALRVVKPPAPQRQKVPPKQKEPPPPATPKAEDQPQEEIKLPFRKTSGTWEEPYKCEDGTEKIKWPLSMPKEFVERHRRIAGTKLPGGLTRSDWALEVLSRELDRLEGEK